MPAYLRQKGVEKGRPLRRDGISSFEIGIVYAFLRILGRVQNSVRQSLEPPPVDKVRLPDGRLIPGEVQVQQLFVVLLCCSSCMTGFRRKSARGFRKKLGALSRVGADALIGPPGRTPERFGPNALSHKVSGRCGHRPLRGRGEKIPEAW